MLVTGTVDSADLGRIVRRELEIAGWPEERVAAASGPDTRLDDESAQALALAAHELVTNSVKHGALAGKGDLAVGWRHDAGDIELRGVESTLPETPRFDKDSFGRPEANTDELQSLMRTRYTAL